MDIEALRTSAKQYGYDISDDGAIIAPSGKTLSTRVTAKGKRLQVMGGETKLATLKGESELGPFFLAKFYYAEKVSND